MMHFICCLKIPLCTWNLSLVCIIQILQKLLQNNDKFQMPYVAQKYASNCRYIQFYKNKILFPSSCVFLSRIFCLFSSKCIQLENPKGNMASLEPLKWLNINYLKQYFSAQRRPLNPLNWQTCYLIIAALSTIAYNHPKTSFTVFASPCKSSECNK